MNTLVDEKLDETTELEKNVKHDDLIYRYKGETPDEKFDKYDNALNIIFKIKKWWNKTSWGKKWSNKI